jgi:hypothetical protein
VPSLSRLSNALKALRQLGFIPVTLNALYKFGLASGHYRRAIQPPAPVDGLQLQPLLPLPARDEILAILGEAGRAKLLAEADEIVSGHFRQFGGDPVEINLTPSTPLCHWAEYESHIRPPTSDIKFTWEPARFGWAFTLGRAWYLSGEEKYAEAFWRYFETFTAANPPYWGPNWMSGQEVGLRLMAFTWAGEIFAKAAATTPERLAALAVSTAAHAARIPATLLYARSQNNNHLLTEAAALYTAGLALPDHPQAEKWRKTGQKWLRWCFIHQIDAYGEYVQHSTNYHRLMLQTALWVDVIARRAKPDEAISSPNEGIASLPTVARNDTTRENLALATHWLLSLLDPVSGQVPNLGANDGALIFPLSIGDFRDFRPVAQAAARAFLGYTLPSGPWDEMALWFGLPQTETQLKIPRYPGDHLYAPHSWGYLRAVRLKSRPSHADQLHFDLWWRGLNIAQDAGTYLYNADPPWDNQLTSTLAHNTVSVDGLEQMTRVSRFLYLDWADASSKRHFETNADYLQQNSARTYAYAKVNVRHERLVTVFSDEHWRVEDELLNVVMPGQAPSAHVYRLHWLLLDWEWVIESREERAEKCEQGVEIRLKSPLGWVELAISADQPIKRVGVVRAGELIHGDGLTSPVFGWVSPTYSVKIPALSLAVEVQSTESVKFATEFEFPNL